MKYNFDALKNFMDKRFEELGLPGIDCIIYQDHKEIFRHQAGFSDIEEKTLIAPNTLYNIYSATKVIVCVAGMQLVEKGQMLLSDPLYKYLPEFEKMQVKYGTFVATPAKKHIKVRDLFMMTAGLSYDLDMPQVRKLREETNGDFNSRQFVRALAKEPLLFEPGEGWNYSYCHDVLGALIEVISDQSLEEYLQENIFKPLGMKDTHFFLPEEKKKRLAPQYQYDANSKSAIRITDDCLARAGSRHESGGGGLIMSLEDYILFADALACGGIGKSGKKIISQRSIDLMRANHLEGKAMEDYRRMVSAKGTGYGLGVSTVFNSAASFTLVPEGAFKWGGLAGAQNLIDPTNRLSVYVAQHLVFSPKKYHIEQMKNIIYAAIT